jgi:hypothetical protein
MSRLTLFRNGMRTVLAVVFGLGTGVVFGSFASGCRWDSSPPAFTAPPTVSANPNHSVPLAAIVRFSADEPVQTSIEVSDGERGWQVTYDDSHMSEDGLAVLGMWPDRHHELRISIRDTSRAIPRHSSSRRRRCRPIRRSSHPFGKR